MRPLSKILLLTVLILAGAASFFALRPSANAAAICSSQTEAGAVANFGFNTTLVDIYIAKPNLNTPDAERPALLRKAAQKFADALGVTFVTHDNTAAVSGQSVGDIRAVGRSELSAAEAAQKLLPVMRQYPSGGLYIYFSKDNFAAHNTLPKTLVMQRQIGDKYTLLAFLVSMDTASLASQTFSNLAMQRLVLWGSCGDSPKMLELAKTTALKAYNGANREEIEPASARSALPPDGSFTQDVSERLSLKKGWNMTSSPVSEPALTLAAIRRSCNIKAGWAYAYDATNPQKWVVSNSLEPMSGYFIHATNDCSLTINGQRAPRHRILTPGWNMISSYLSWQNLNRLNRCNLISPIYHYDPAKAASTPDDPYIKVLETQALDDAQGYWVKVAAACEVSEALPSVAAPPLTSSGGGLSQEYRWVFFSAYLTRSPYYAKDLPERKMPFNEEYFLEKTLALTGVDIIAWAFWNEWAPPVKHYLVKIQDREFAAVTTELPKLARQAVILAGGDPAEAGKIFEVRVDEVGQNLATKLAGLAKSVSRWDYYSALVADCGGKSGCGYAAAEIGAGIYLKGAPRYPPSYLKYQGQGSSKQMNVVVGFSDPILKNMTEANFNRLEKIQQKIDALPVSESVKEQVQDMISWMVNAEIPQVLTDLEKQIQRLEELIRQGTPVKFTKVDAGRQLWQARDLK